MYGSKPIVRCALRMVAALACLFSSSVFSADTVKYDTAWSFTYDGGLTKMGDVIDDNFRDVQVLPEGGFLCVGETEDSSFLQSALIVKISPVGKVLQKSLVHYVQGCGASAVLASRNGDFVVGGYRYNSPWLARLDASSLAIKSDAWYYDSTHHKTILAQGAVINSMIESPNGNIHTTAGDILFQTNNHSYAAYLQFDSSSGPGRMNEWNNVPGYEIEGWSIAAGETQGYMLGGKQSLFLIDTSGNLVAKNEYGFNVPGTGSQANTVQHVRKLRSGALMVAGQSYEEDCWTRYGRLSYDAWWSPLSTSGTDNFRNVAGVSGVDDALLDLAQLESGNIAFLGVKGTAPDSGLWVFVTDSTTKTILWQKQYNLPGLDKGSPRANLLPITIKATPDSGFIIVGQEAARGPNNNAFAFKFTSHALASSVTAPRAAERARMGSGGIFHFEAKDGIPAELRLFDLQGRPAARYRFDGKGAGPADIKVDVSLFSKGIYFWRFESSGLTQQGRLLIDN